MQILLGVNETIIRINSKSIKIDYIQSYITTHFRDRIVKNNTIYIPTSSNHHHRRFLLKWLFTLYAKKSSYVIPELKDSLIKREHKPIKIELKEDILHRISYSIIDESSIKVVISPANIQIGHKLKTFLQSKVIVMPTHLIIKLDSDEAKRLFKIFITSKDIINEPHIHIYNRAKIVEFFKEKSVQKFINPIDEAYIILGSSPNDSVKIVKKRYKKLAKEFHPDRVSYKDKNEILIYTKRFQRILEAYEIVKKEKLIM